MSDMLKLLTVALCAIGWQIPALAVPPILDTNGHEIDQPQSEPLPSPLDPNGARSGFDIDRHGFEFQNNFPGPLTLKVPLPGLLGVLVKVPIDLSLNAYGLCGGMTYAAHDSYFYESTTESPVTTPDQLAVPTPESQLHQYLWERQMDSLKRDNWWAVRKLIDWTGRKLSRVRSMTRDEFENKVAVRINDGWAVPLMLVRGNKINGQLFTKNHQVLAIGYEYWTHNAGNDGWVVVTYDPNHPGKEKLLFLDSREEWVRDPNNGATYYDQQVFRGFFVAQYRGQKPYWADSVNPAPTTCHDPRGPAFCPGGKYDPLGTARIGLRR